MSSETIALLIKFVPTILVGLIILLCMLRGFLRGFRKSNILLINYLLSLVVGFVFFFTLSKKAFTTDWNFIFQMLGPDFASAHTIYDFVGVLLAQNVPDFASLASNYYFQGIIEAFGGLIINGVLAVVCLVVIPIILRIVFYLFYLLLYSERKRKRHKKAQGEVYRKHRLLCSLTGLVRGIVCATLVVSFVNSFYFIVAGGDFYEKDEEPKNITLLQSIGGDIDVNMLYNAMKESRKTGINVVYDAIKIQGKPIDYYSDAGH